MVFLSVKNRAESTLASDITATAVSLTVATGEGTKFPASNFHITIDDEILLCSSRSTDVLTVVREKESTTGTAHSSGVAVELRITAQIIEEIQDGSTPLTLEYIVSDDLKNSNDTERFTDATTYTKLKECKFNEALSVVRIKFDLRADYNDKISYAQLYKNGSPIGIERSTQSLTYVNFSEDFSNIAVNDLIQLYVKNQAAFYGTDVANLRFYYAQKITKFADETLVTALNTTGGLISITNQDP